MSELPCDMGSTRGQELEDVRARSFEVGGNDALYIRADGGGGYGDPVERDPKLVFEDLRLWLITAGPARDIYGVVLAGDGNGLDLEGTRQRRLVIREARIGRKLPPSVAERAAIARTPHRISEYLQATAENGHSMVQCTWCGHQIARGDENWKDKAVRRVAPISAAGPLRFDNATFHLREYFCPGCATVLDVEVAEADVPPLYDRIERWN